MLLPHLGRQRSRFFAACALAAALVVPAFGATAATASPASATAGARSGLCLDVTGAGAGNGAPVELWTCNGGTNQQWTLG